MPIIVPDTFAVYDTGGCHPGSANKTWAWIGLSTPVDSGGQVTFFPAGKPLEPIITMAFAAGQIKIFGPIAVREGVAWTQPTAGCAVVWLKQKEQHA